MRQRGEDVFFLTGTDEHGEPVAVAAEQLGVTPQELADRNAERFRALAPRLDASNDFFIRTSDPRHKLRVQEILGRVRDNGYVYKGTYAGWYCPRCADFKTDTEMGPDCTCAIHHIPLEHHEEDNYFFALSAFQERLEALYAERPDFVLPAHHFNEARSFIGQGLQDISLSRSKLTWGVQVPWDETQVFYVWFDALLNYVTALSFAREGEDLTDRFWPADFHLIGKDILKFHAVFWPALLMAADLAPPRHLFVHGFLLMNGEKMSKSQGNVLDPFEVIDTFGTDALRYYCFREVSFGRDGSVSRDGFDARYEGELANELGNLASRTIAMVNRYRDAVIPPVLTEPALTADFAGLSTVGRRAARPRRDQPGARGDLAAGPATEPLRRGAGAVEAREGARAGRRARRACWRRWPRGCASWPSCWCRICRHRWGFCWPRSASPTTASGQPSSRESGSGGRGPDDPAAVSEAVGRAWSTATPISISANRPTRAGRTAAAAHGVSRILTVGDRRRVVCHGARSRPRPPECVRGDRPPPEQR